LNERLRAGLAAKSLARYTEREKDSFVSAVQLQQKQEELLDVNCANAMLNAAWRPCSATYKLCAPRC